MRKISLVVLVAICWLSACTEAGDEPSSGTVSEPSTTVSESTVPADGDPEPDGGPIPEDLPVGEALLTVDGMEQAGSGIAFRSGDEILVRLLFGAPNNYLEFNLDGTASGMVFPIETGTSQPAVVIGQDAVSEDYRVVDSTSTNQFTFDRVDDTQITGTVRLSAENRNKTEPQALFGRFTVELADSGTDWNCDFAGEIVRGCGFE